MPTPRFLLLAAIIAAGCGGEPNAPQGPSGPPPVALLSVTPGSATLIPPQTNQLTASVLDAAGNVLTDRAITWSSSAPAVATVSASGLLTAVAAGTATITATSEGKSGSAAITVVPSVALLSVTPVSARLVPQQTNQLTASTRDAAGNVLTGRTITWTSSAPVVATVSATGLVTAVTVGTATITAVSEGKSGSAAITVGEGGLVGATGGTVASSDGRVTLILPAGAVSTGLALTITPTASPPTPLAGTTAVRGTTYVFGPEGAQFGVPVTVTIKYDPASLPAWVLPGDLVIQRWNGTQWSKLTNLVVNSAARTVTGQTPGFSTVGVYFLNPQVTLTPIPASVNSIQRSVTFTAEVSGEGRSPDALQFTWTNTGANGTFTGQSRNTIQYTAVTPILPPGDIDGVRVVVRGQFEPNGAFEVIGEAHTVVRSDLNLLLQLLPASSLVQYAGTVQLAATVIDRNGTRYDNTPYLRYEWTSTTTSGTINVGTQRTSLPAVTYSAYPASQQSNVFPKGDKITVKVFMVVYRRTRLLLSDGFTVDSTVTEQGQKDAFVQVIPQYQVSLVPQSAQLQAGQSTTFQARLTPAWQGDEQLFFQWNTTGNQGTLSAAQGSATYTAAANPTGGTDFVDVDVRVGFIGQLGTARASVSVEARQQVVAGSFFITEPVGLDAGRQCVESYIVFPVVPGARAYEMHAFGFNDPAFWGTDIRRSFSVPLPTGRGCSRAGWGLTGVFGGQFQFYLGSFSGPTNTIAGAIASANSRFAGMRVEVTLRY